jgi:hypothetical protein
MDFPGLVLIIGAVQCLLLAVYWGGILKPWKDNDVIGTLLGFGLLLVAFIAVEYKQGQHAMLVHKLLKKREVLVGSIFSFFVSGALFVLIHFLPIYFQAIRGVSAVRSGIRHLALVIPICECILRVREYCRVNGLIGIYSNLYDHRRRTGYTLRIFRPVHDLRILPFGHRMWPRLHVHRAITCFHVARLSDSHWYRLRPVVPDAYHGSSGSCCI